MGRLVLVVILAISLAGTTYILLDLHSDGPLAMTFCFGLPLVFVAIAIAMGTLFDGAVLFGRRSNPAVVGRCRHCGTEYSAGENTCKICGMPTGYNVDPHRLRWRRPEDRPAREAASRAALAPVPHAASTAATILVEQARIHEVERLDTIEACLSDPAVVRRIYRIAARRLHPDSNNGVHLPEWYTLQSAINVLNRHHQM